jgi:hypothetical protein
MKTLLRPPTTARAKLKPFTPEKTFKFQAEKLKREKKLPLRNEKENITSVAHENSSLERK